LFEIAFKRLKVFLTLKKSAFEKKKNTRLAKSAFKGLKSLKIVKKKHFWQKVKNEVFCSKAFFFFFLLKNSISQT
jgi:hypothetical protein